MPKLPIYSIKNHMKKIIESRDLNIPDPNHMPYGDRVKWFDEFMGQIVYPQAWINHYADRYGVEPSDVIIESNGLIHVAESAK